MSVTEDHLRSLNPTPAPGLTTAFSPSFGLEWKRGEKEVKAEQDNLAFRCRPAKDQRRLIPLPPGVL